MPWTEDIAQDVFAKLLNYHTKAYPISAASIFSTSEQKVTTVGQ